jgi:hypothetical protein
MAVTAYETAVASFLENAAYAAEGDVTKARAFLTACIQLAVLQPKRTVNGGAQGFETELAPERIQEERARCEAWLGRNDLSRSAAGTVTSFVFER